MDIAVLPLVDPKKTKPPDYDGYFEGKSYLTIEVAPSSDVRIDYGTWRSDLDAFFGGQHDLSFWPTYYVDPDRVSLEEEE